jgi:hypothetical protein
MEHRLGVRTAVQIPVRWETANRGLVSIGRLTNVSLSGGFLADFDLRLLSLILVVLESPSQQMASIPAYVARRCTAGIGIEWCEWAPVAVVELLRPVVTHPSASALSRPARSKTIGSS